MCSIPRLGAPRLVFRAQAAASAQAMRLALYLFGGGVDLRVRTIFGGDEAPSEFDQHLAVAGGSWWHTSEPVWRRAVADVLRECGPVPADHLAHPGPSGASSRPASSPRLRTPALSKIDLVWSCTVCSVRCNEPAMPRFDSPRRMRVATSFSRRVRPYAASWTAAAVCGRAGSSTTVTRSVPEDPFRREACTSSQPPSRVRTVARGRRDGGALPRSIADRVATTACTAIGSAPPGHGSSSDSRC